MTLHRKVCIIYAGTNGYLDDLPVKDVRRFESEFYKFMDDKYPDLGHSIEKTGVLDDAGTETLKAALGQFKKQFTA